MTRATLRAALLASLLPLAGCLDPTEVIVEVHTDVPCTSEGGVAITVGSPEDVESAAPTVVTHDCKGGLIGTLVAVPQSSRDAALGIKVTMSLGGNVETDCVAANGYKGCIVARRELHYLPRHSITVPIFLYQDCRDVACDAATTCDQTQLCVTNQLPSPSCTGDTCTASDVTVDAGPGAPDASAPGEDAGTPAGLDAAQPAGLDAAQPGLDAATAGEDAGRPDASAAYDAGCSPCTAVGQQLCDPGGSGLIGTCAAVDGGACLVLSNLTGCDWEKTCIPGNQACTCGDQSGPACTLGATSCLNGTRNLYTCATDGAGCPNWTSTDCQGTTGNGVKVCNQKTTATAECDCPAVPDLGTNPSQDVRNQGCATLDDSLCVWNNSIPTVMAKCQLSPDACLAWLQTTDCSSPGSLVCDDSGASPVCVCPPHGSPAAGCGGYGQDCEYYVDPTDSAPPPAPAPTGVNWPPACRFATVTAALQALSAYSGTRSDDHQVEIVVTWSNDQTVGNVAPPWMPATSYYGGQRVSKPSFNGHNYVAQGSGGTSGNAEPLWSTTQGDQISDSGVTWVMDGTPAARVVLSGESFPLTLPFRTTLRGDCGSSCSERDSFVIQFNQTNPASAAVALGGDQTQLNNIRVENLNGLASTPAVLCDSSAAITPSLTSIALIGWSGSSSTQLLRGLEVDGQCSPNVTKAFINGFAGAGIYVNQATSSQTLSLTSVWLGPWLVGSADTVPATGTNLHGISGAGAGTLTISDSEVVGSYSDGIVIQAAPSMSIENTRIEGNKGTGLTLDSATLSGFDANVVQSNYDAGLRITNLVFENGDYFVANVIRHNGWNTPAPQIDLGSGTEFWLNGGPSVVQPDKSTYCQVTYGQAGGAPANQIYCYAPGNVGVRCSGTQAVNIANILWDQPATPTTNPALNVDYSGSNFVGTDSSNSCGTIQCQ